MHLLRSEEGSWAFSCGGGQAWVCVSSL
jgi:hypothetical protein